MGSPCYERFEGRRYAESDEITSETRDASWTKHGRKQNTRGEKILPTIRFQTIGVGSKQIGAAGKGRKANG
jgi:hypothetical protein